MIGQATVDVEGHPSHCLCGNSSFWHAAPMWCKAVQQLPYQ